MKPHITFMALAVLCLPCSLIGQDFLFNVTPESIASASDASITLTFSEDLSPYEFMWTGPSIISSTERLEEQYNLSPGTYCVSVTNSYCCIASGCVSIPDCGTFTGGGLSTNTVSPTGPLASDGSIELVLPDGVSPSMFIWSGPNGLHFGQNIYDLSPGNYSITLTDETCGTASVTVSLTHQCPVFSFTDIYRSVPCPGQSNGSLIVTSYDGIHPLSYEWSNGDTGYPVATNLSAGTYTLTITDQTGCTATATRELEDNTITITSTTQNPCTGGSDGSISVDVQGTSGSVLYNYLWSNGQTTKNISDLGVGTYILTVTDTKGCTKVHTTELIPRMKASVASVQNANMCSGNDVIDCGGGINLLVEGAADALFSWSGPDGFSATTQDIDDLCPGKYNVTITSNTPNECQMMLSNIKICCCTDQFGEAGTSEHACNPDEIYGPASPITITPIITPGQSAVSGGSIALQVDGGAAYPYYFSWSGGQNGAYSSTEQNLYGLMSGTYCVTVTDGCETASECFSMASCEESFDDYVQPSIKNTCGSLSLGKIELEVDGFANVSYSWSNGQTSNTIENLSAGMYSVTVNFGQVCQHTADDIVVIKQFDISASQQLTCHDVPSPHETKCIRKCRCNGTPVPDTEVDAERRPDYQGLHCKVDYYCGGQKTGTKRDFYKKEWAFLVDASGLTEWNRQNPCARYKICPMTGDGPGYVTENDRRVYLSTTTCITQCRTNIFSSWNTPVPTSFFEYSCRTPGSGGGGVFVYQVPVGIIPKDLDVHEGGDTIRVMLSAQSSENDSSYLMSYNNTLVGEYADTFPGDNTFFLSKGNSESSYWGGTYSPDIMTVDSLMFAQSYGERDIFLTKFSPDGDPVWTLLMGSENDDQLSALAIDEDESTVLTGYIHGDMVVDSLLFTVQKQTGFLMQFDSSARLLWANLISSSGAIVPGEVSVHDAGFIATTGTFIGTLDYDGEYLFTQQQNSTTEGLYVLSVDTDGRLITPLHFEAGEGSFSYSSLSALGNGEIVFTTNYKTSLKLNGSSTALTHVDTNSRLFIGAYNIVGEEQWHISEGGVLGGIEATKIIQMPDERILVSGQFTGTVTFSDGSTLVSHGGRDIFIACYSSSGVLEWVKQEGSTGDEYCTDAEITSDLLVVYTGYFMGDSTVIENRVFEGTLSVPTSYLVAVQLDTLGIPSRAFPVAGNTEKTLDDGFAVTVYPNPFRDELKINIVSDRNQSARLSISNVFGMQVHNRSALYLSKGENRYVLQSSSLGLTSGIYYLTLTTDTGSIVSKKLTYMR